jgi:hypothetical protein
MMQVIAAPVQDWQFVKKLQKCTMEVLKFHPRQVPAANSCLQLIKQYNFYNNKNPKV